MTDQTIFNGDDAADLLFQETIARVTRDCISFGELRCARVEAALAEPDPFRRNLLTEWATTALISNLTASLAALR